MNSTPSARRIVLDLRGIETVAELHALLKDAFAFPPYYGCNWDALWDCLSALEARPIEIDVYGFVDLQARLGSRVIPFFDVLYDFHQSRGDAAVLRFHNEEE